MEQDINEPQPDAPRAGIVAAGIFSTILLFLFGLLCAFLLAFDCGGDGGEPYNAEASLRGEFCETPGHLGLLLFLVFIPALICVIGMIGASKRRSWRHLLFAVGIAVTAAVSPTAVWFALPGECSAEQKQILDSRACASY